MNDIESTIENLETQFPAMSGMAFGMARKRTFACGQSVLEADAGVIYEVFPDGTRILVKRIEPPTPIADGTTKIIG